MVSNAGTISLAPKTSTVRRPPEASVMNLASTFAPVPRPGKFLGQVVCMRHFMVPWLMAGFARPLAAATPPRPRPRSRNPSENRDVSWNTPWLLGGPGWDAWIIERGRRIGRPSGFPAAVRYSRMSCGVQASRRVVFRVRPSVSSGRHPPADRTPRSAGTGSCIPSWGSPGPRSPDRHRASLRRLPVRSATG